MGDLLKWAIILALIAVAAGWLGFGGIARGASTLSKILFGIFLIVVVMVVLVLVGVFNLVT